MTVAARAARNVTLPDSSGHHDVRSGSTVRSGTYAFEVGDEVVTGWHFHSLHQLEYAIQGVARVETEHARFLLPPQQAVWIPAGTRHCTTLTRVRTLAVFFDPELGIAAGERVRIIAVEPVLREMIRYAARWPIGRESDDPFATSYFDALARLVSDALEREMPLRLPTSQDPLVSAIMQYTLANLHDVTEADVCRGVGVSDRTLRRAFARETGLSWRDYLVQSRLLEAMARLAEPGPSILQIATDVGFASMSGFTRAFRRYTGQTPSDYRHSVDG